MTATPLFDHSRYPISFNCKLSKTFFGVPKKCGECNKIIVCTGFECQHCSFRGHKKCIMIGHGAQVSLRSRQCSLSRLSQGDNSFLKDGEINSNFIDCVFDDDGDLVRGRQTFGASSPRRPSRPSLGNASSTYGIRSIAASLTTSDEPSSSLPPSPSVSPTASQPSSPTYASSLVTDYSGISQHCSYYHHQVSYPSTLQQQRHTEQALQKDDVSSAASSSNIPQTVSFLDRFLKLFPSWTASTVTDRHSKHGDEDMDDVESAKRFVYGSNGAVTLRQHSVALSDSSRSSANILIKTGLAPDSLQQQLPRAKSACGVAGMTGARGGGSKRPKTLSACSTGAASSCSYNTSPVPPSARTPVDDFNSSILEDLFSTSQRKSTSAEPAMDRLTTTLHCTKKTSQLLHRKLRWVRHIAGDRSARSQDSVTGSFGPAGFSPLLAKLRRRSATVKMPDRAAVTAHQGVRGLESVLSNAAVQEADANRLAVQEEDAMVARARERLANTWPLSGLHINYDDCNQKLADGRYLDELYTEENVEIYEDQGYYTEEPASEERRNRDRESRISDLGEWTIPYTDLEFGDCIHECRHMTTYKGRWHGDVMIYTYLLDGTEHGPLVHSFLDNVRTLTKIRHENIALFMGASIEAPLLAVVTTVRKGCNLYNAVHVENRRIPQNAKLNIARQVAQGMGYLHAKGIVLKTLTSKSVYLECKVKISMVDDGAPLKRHDRPQKGCMRRGHLTYISPELMQTLHVQPPALRTIGTGTKESDVYAFGTILYEMFAGDFPFAHLEPEAIIWAVGTGRRQDLENVRCNVAMKSLIEDCWSFDPTYRPSFTEVLKELQHTAALHKKNSSSVPEKLNKTGLNRLPYNY